MAEGTFLSWEEVQRLALPPNAAMLIPPTPEPEVPALAAGPPSKADWLDDGFIAESMLKAADPNVVPVDPDAERAAAASPDQLPGPVRLLANLIAYNAVLEYATSPRKKDDEEEQQIPSKPRDDPAE